jgi:hypothetical protein
MRARRPDTVRSPAVSLREIEDEWIAAANRSGHIWRRVPCTRTDERPSSGEGIARTQTTL